MAREGAGSQSALASHASPGGIGISFLTFSRCEVARERHLAVGVARARERASVFARSEAHGRRRYEELTHVAFRGAAVGVRLARLETSRGLAPERDAGRPRWADLNVVARLHHAVATRIVVPGL